MQGIKCIDWEPSAWFITDLKNDAWQQRCAERCNKCETTNLHPACESDSDNGSDDPLPVRLQHNTAMLSKVHVLLIFFDTYITFLYTIGVMNPLKPQDLLICFYIRGMWVVLGNLSGISRI